MAASPRERLAQLQVAERAILIQDQAKMFASQQALTDQYHNKMLGVPIPKDDMIHVGDNYQPAVATPAVPAVPAKTGMSPLVALALGALSVAVPGAGVLGYMLATAKPVAAVVNQALPVPVPAVPPVPMPAAKAYDFGVQMQVVPPVKK